MAFIEMVPEDKAEGRLRQQYEDDRKSRGFVPHTTTILSLRPDVIDTWNAFAGSIRKHLRLRTYELVTIAASVALKCRYCMLAHGSILLNNGFTLEQLRTIITDYHKAELEPVEIAMMDFAQQIIRSAGEVKRTDVDHLRSLGLTDTDILDITLAVTMRSCFSKTFDALGAEPDTAYDSLAAQLEDLLPPPKA